MTDTMEITATHVVWTPERVETVRGMWVEGATASQIAAHFVGATRNMICGLVHRNNFERAEGFERPPSEPKPRKPRPSRARSLNLGGSGFMGDLFCLPVGNDSLHLTIEQLEAGHCRWPELDGPVQTYCGGAAKSGRSYCAFHAAKAFVPIVRKPRPVSGNELNRGRGGVFGAGRSV